MVVLAVLAVPAGFGIYTWRQAGALETAISYGQYGRAQAVYRRAPWLSMLDEQQAAYVDAQVLMEQGELEQARQAFLVLEGYQDSEELAENIRIYLKALENDDIYKRYILLSNIEDFLEASQLMQECVPQIFDKAMEDYKKPGYGLAEQYFKVTSQYEGYEISELYLEAIHLCDMIRGAGYSSYPREISEKLRYLEQYIDVSYAATRDMLAFMRGEWYASSGNYIDIPSEGSFYTSFYLPSSTYHFYEDGMVNTGNEQYYATWEYVNFDTLYVTVNGRSEYYYRTV